MLELGKGCSNRLWLSSVCPLFLYWRGKSIKLATPLSPECSVGNITSVSARFRIQSMCLVSKVPGLCLRFPNQFQDAFHVIGADWNYPCKFYC